MALKKILLWCMLGFSQISFCQESANSIIQKYQDTGGIEKDSRYYLIEVSPSAPQKLINKIFLASTRKFAANLYIIDRSGFEGNLFNNSYINRLIKANNDWKLSLSANALKASGIGDQQKITLFNFLLNDLHFAATFLEKYPAFKMGAKILTAQKILSVKMTYRQVKDLLLSEDAVIFIDAVTAKPREELGTPGYDLSENKINLVHNQYPGINGAGQHVSIKEDQYDTTDIDLKGRLEYSPLASVNLSNHANFMATIIAGAANSVYYAKGAAWAAQVSSSSFESILPDPDDYYLQRHITVQNHSYGTVADNSYGLNAVAFDQSAAHNPALLHVFSCGNIGSATSTAGNYAGLPGYANLTGNFKMAKNILTVGAVDSFGNVAPLSSRGPAYDGRVKPELVAFQQNGTSEAAALVSGTALLLQQYYSLLYPRGLMPSALVKAVLINTADDTGAPGPDFKTGFGNMNAMKAMNLLKEDKIFTGNIGQGGTQIFHVTLPANTSLLKITLAWNDTPAAPLASNALVNDLDLEVLLPANNISWQPWVLNPFPNIDSLNSVALRKKDSLNNVEQVTIENPAAGDYEIRIKGYHLPAGTQKFYVAYCWDSLDYFNWQSPTNTDLVEAGSRTLLRWQNSFNGNGTIEYRIVGTNDWKPVAANTDLHKNCVYWNVPDTISQAVVRMKIGNEYFYSDSFLITSLPKPSTGFICGDSMLVYWNKIKTISRYQLYQLGEKYMEPLAIVEDTAAVIQKSNLTDRYIAVAPVLKNGLKAQKSYAFNYTTQGAGCFINAFYVDKNADIARLTLSLGTLINVAAISFEKLSLTGYTVINSAAINNQLQYFYQYGPLTQGISYFRARVTLAGGKIIYSEPEAVFYAAPGKYVLLPVPVYRNNDITLITALPDGEVVSLYDVLGRMVLRQEIISSRELLKTSGLQAGQYFYRITKKGERVASGKLIIL